MKRTLSTLLSALTFLSLALFVMTIIVWDLSWGESISGDYRCGSLWHVALEPGDIQLDNQPQRKLEAKKLEEERRSLTTALDREPYGSAAYRQALAQSRVFDAAADRRMAAIPLIKRSISISMLLGLCAAVPLIRFAAWLFQRRRDFAGQFKGSFAVVAVLWLGMCVLVIVFWGRSNRPHYDELVYGNHSPANRTSAFAALRSLQGHVILIWTKRSWDSQTSFDRDTVGFEAFTPNGLSLQSDRYQTLPRKVPFLQRLGFRVSWGSGKTPPEIGGPGIVSHASIDLPHWFLLLLLVIPMVLTLRRRLRRARRAKSCLCISCGYDLRESPLRCPECGIAPSKLGRGG